MGRYAELCQIEGDELGPIESGDEKSHSVCRKAEDTICVLTKGSGIGCNFLKYDKQVN